MDPTERQKVAQVLSTLLDAIAREAGKTREWLSLEIEQVTARALFEVFRLASARRRPSQHPSVQVPAERTPTEPDGEPEPARESRPPRRSGSD
jgi:hypothetical protein